MVSVYAVNISALPDPKAFAGVSDNLALLQKITSSRRKRVLEYLRADDRKRCLGAGLLIAEILPLYGENPERITLGPMGKPESRKVQFNLSHAGDWALCAVGKKAVGCDIERIDKEPDGVAQHFFHPDEAAYLQSFQGEERNEMFFRIWTWKESYLKMTGEGMRVSLQDFAILPAGGRILVRRGEEILSCRIMEYSIRGYQVSVCAEESEFAKRIIYMDYSRTKEDII